MSRIFKHLFKALIKRLIVLFLSSKINRKFLNCFQSKNVRKSCSDFVWPFPCSQSLWAVGVVKEIAFSPVSQKTVLSATVQLMSSARLMMTVPNKPYSAQQECVTLRTKSSSSLILFWPRRMFFDKNLIFIVFQLKIQWFN